MKKKILLKICLVTFITSFTFAQTNSNEPDISWGPEIKSHINTRLRSIIGKDETGIYAFKTKEGIYEGAKEKYLLEHYNHNLDLTNSVEFELKTDKQKREYEGVITLKKDSYILSSFINKKLQTKFLFAQKINMQTLTLDKDLKKVVEISLKGRKAYNEGSFIYKLSKDSSKLVIYSFHLYYEGKNTIFGLNVFDNNLNEIWGKQIETPYKDKLFDFEQLLLDNNGDIHLLANIFNEKRKYDINGKPNYKYHIFSYLNNGEESKKYIINLEDNFISEMRIAINDDKDFLCFGLYSTVGVYFNEGSYCIKINRKTKDIISKDLKKFGIDFITQGMSNNDIEKVKKNLSNNKYSDLHDYKFNDIIYKDDGSIVLIGEEFFIQHIPKSDGSMASKYHFNNILVINITPDGKIEWFKKINKKQATLNDGGQHSSYSVSLVDDYLYFVFNDHPSNLDYSGTGSLSCFSKSFKYITVLVKMDSSGQYNKEFLYNFDKAQVFTQPKACKRITNNKLIIYGFQGKGQRFAKLTLK